MLGALTNARTVVILAGRFVSCLIIQLTRFEDSDIITKRVQAWRPAAHFLLGMGCWRNAGQKGVMTRVDSFLRNTVCDVKTNLRLLHIEAEEQILVSQVEFAIGNDWMGPDLSR